jgi:uncharacterized membrane protein
VESIQGLEAAQRLRAILNFFDSVVFAAICILIILKRYPGIARVAEVIKMFPQFKKLNNESGLVLFIVLMVSIIIMIVSVGILTQSMNETNYAQQQIDQIVSDQLAKGIFWNAYSSAYSSGNMTNMQNVGISTVMNGRTYNVMLNTTATTNQYSVSANYDTL